MSGNPSNIQLGGCQVIWGSYDLGFTTGGVDVSILTTTKPCQVDQFGACTANEFITGRYLTVKMKIAETDLDKIYFVLSTAGATQPNGPDTGVLVQTGLGIELMEDAAPMLLHPVNAPNNTTDMVFPAIAYTGQSHLLSYKYDEMRSLNLVFIAYQDVSENFFYYGSSALGTSLANPNYIVASDGSYITDVSSNQFIWR